MTIEISGVNNNDKITASDGKIDILSGVDYTSEVTAPSFKVGSNIQFGNAGIITATTLVGNVTGNINHTSNLLLQISGSEKLRIANSGAFGLNGTNYGTSGQVLTSQGSGSSPTWSVVDLSAVTGATGDFSIADKIVHTGDTNTAIRFPAADTITAETGGSERLRIDSNGYVMIGNSAASAQYSKDLVVGNTTGEHGITIISQSNSIGRILFSDSTSSGAGTYQGQLNYNHSADELVLSTYTLGQVVMKTSNTERLRITSTGQLLLGETSAVDSNTAIQFTKNVSGNQARFIFRNNANDGNSRVRLECMTLNRAANADTFSGIEKYQSGGMAIYNGESTNQYSGISLICGNHNVFRLKNGNHSGHDCAHIQAIWGTSNGLHMEQGGPQSGTHKAIRFTTSHYGGERGYIGVTLGGTSYNSSSDYRQKQDVVDLTGAIDRVKSFKPRRFKWKDDPTYTVDGFLAHEAQTVVPESVVGEKDAVDENDNPKYQVIDQSKLVPLLTASIKELIAKVENLETKVSTLEGS